MQCAFRCQLQRSVLPATTPTSTAAAAVNVRLQRTLKRQQCSLSLLSLPGPGPALPFSRGNAGSLAEQSGTRQLRSTFSGCLFRDSHAAAQPLFPSAPSCRHIATTSIRGSSRKGGAGSRARIAHDSLHCSRSVSTSLRPAAPSTGQNGGDSLRRSFLSRAYTQSPLYQHTQVSRYHSSSGSSGSNIDALQTWRRPLFNQLLPPGSETRSLATMPTNPLKGSSPSDPSGRLQRSLAAVPHHSIKNEIKLRCTEFDHKGNVKTTAGEFLKSDLCQQHGLHARDLRKIDSSFNNQMPVILVRPEAILVNVGHIRALIKADLVVLFDSFGSTDSYNQSIFIYDLEEKLRMSTSAAGGLPFEFRALEAIFISVLSSLQSEMEVLVHFVTNLLAHLEESIDQNKLKELLQYSKKLSQFESKTLLIRDIFVEVLDQDEDLANMYLTEKKLGRPRTKDSHEEIEILLESYLKQVEEIANTVSIVKQQMQSTEEIVNVILGANRNQLLLFELRIAMGTLGMSSGAIIASLYGMNLHNYLETNPHAFAIVGSTALGISMMVFAFCSRKLKVLAKGTT